MSLCLLINLLSISIPFLVSFHPRIKLYKNWGSLILALLMAMIPFIIWDIYFTEQEYWGFNPDYHLPFLLLGMPIEEWLFFFCIPYASIFIHYSLAYFKPNLLISDKVAKIITLFFIVILIPIIFLNTDKSYTFINYSFLIFVLLIGYFFGIKHLQRFYISFLIILVPFFVVNGILTGTGLEEPVVWYNNAENLGIRLITIPIEDIGYAFTMIFGNILLIEKFKIKK